MTIAPVLDTHAWIWWVSHDKRLGKPFVGALDDLPADQRPWLSDISLWETATLLEKGRISFNIPFEEWLEAAPKSFHRDPADRLIVATCRVLKLPLLSKDRLVMRAGLVQKWVP